MGTAAPGKYRDTGEAVPEGGIVGVVEQNPRIYVDSPTPVDEGFFTPPLPVFEFPSQSGDKVVEITAQPFFLAPVPVDKKTFIYFVDPKVDVNAPVTEIPLDVIGALPNALENVTTEKFRAVLKNLPTISNPNLVPVLFVQAPRGVEVDAFYIKNRHFLSAAAVTGEYQIVYKVGGAEYYRYEGNFSYPLSIDLPVPGVPERIVRVNG